jgi:hypothetical protein
MPLDIVKKNSSSPFQLQRSMVDQGGRGGAYEAGGFNPDMVYNNDAANAAIESLGKVIGAAIYAKGKDKDKEKEKPKFDTAGAEKARSEYEKIEKDKKDKEDASKNEQLKKQLSNLWKR